MKNSVNTFFSAVFCCFFFTAAFAQSFRFCPTYRYGAATNSILKSASMEKNYIGASVGVEFFLIEKLSASFDVEYLALISALAPATVKNNWFSYNPALHYWLGKNRRGISIGIEPSLHMAKGGYEFAGTENNIADAYFSIGIPLRYTFKATKAISLGVAATPMSIFSGSSYSLLLDSSVQVAYRFSKESQFLFFQ